MDLHELDDLIYDLGMDQTPAQLNLLYHEFERDFIDTSITVDGLNVKVILKNSKLEGLGNYPETFVHLITRKSQGGKRVFDKHRANKIHWVRSILENRSEEEIIYFEYPEVDGTLRNYYWFKEGHFLVIMEKITPDYLILTSFHIDNKRNEEYFEDRYQWYIKQKT